MEQHGTTVSHKAKLCSSQSSPWALLCYPIFSGRGSLKANTQWDAVSQSSMYPTDGSSQASFLAGSLYMDLDHETYVYRVLVCSLAHLMLCFRLWILRGNLPYSHNPCPGEMLSCLYVVSDSCDGEMPLVQPAS